MSSNLIVISPSGSSIPTSAPYGSHVRPPHFGSSHSCDDSYNGGKKKSHFGLGFFSGAAALIAGTVLLHKSPEFLDRHLDDLLKKENHGSGFMKHAQAHLLGAGAYAYEKMGAYLPQKWDFTQNATKISQRLKAGQAHLKAGFKTPDHLAGGTTPRPATPLVEKTTNTPRHNDGGIAQGNIAPKEQEKKVWGHTENDIPLGNIAHQDEEALQGTEQRPLVEANLGSRNGVREADKSSIKSSESVQEPLARADVDPLTNEPIGTSTRATIRTRRTPRFERSGLGDESVVILPHHNEPGALAEYVQANRSTVLNDEEEFELLSQHSGNESNATSEFEMLDSASSNGSIFGNTHPSR